MESFYQRSVKFADQAVLLSVLVCFFVCNFIWYLSTYIGLIKGTLKQIWKNTTVFVFIWKQYTENFAFLILRTLKLFAREVCKFLKKYANFYLILFFVHFFCNSSHISRAPISKRERYFNAKSLAYYFYVKTKVLADFEICMKL